MSEQEESPSCTNDPGDDGGRVKLSEMAAALHGATRKIGKHHRIFALPTFCGLKSSDRQAWLAEKSFSKPHKCVEMLQGWTTLARPPGICCSRLRESPSCKATESTCDPPLFCIKSKMKVKRLLRIKNQVILSKVVGPGSGRSCQVEVGATSSKWLEREGAILTSTCR